MRALNVFLAILVSLALGFAVFENEKVLLLKWHRWIPRSAADYTDL